MSLFAVDMTLIVRVFVLYLWRSRGLYVAFVIHRSRRRCCSRRSGGRVNCCSGKTCSSGVIIASDLAVASGAVGSSLRVLCRRALWFVFGIVVAGEVVFYMSLIRSLLATV